MNAFVMSLISLLFSFLLTMVCIKVFIYFMHKGKVFQIINPDTPNNHQNKKDVPTLGGLTFLFGSSITIIIFSDITHPYIFLPLISMWSFALIGLIDDVMKLVKKETIGLTSLRKLAMQILVSALNYFLVANFSGLNLSSVSAFWHPQSIINIGIWFPLAFLLYMVIFVNAVNVSDGLDGLATQVSLSPLFLLFAVASLFATSHLSHLIIPSQPIIGISAMNLLIVIASMIGSLLAFLWFNGYKATIFMGDVGSHSIGALIGMSALLMKVEFIVAFASGVLLLDLLSSFIQIISIRVFHKKVFLIAPIHHHFEKKGGIEEKIVTRFYIASVILTLVATLFFAIKYR